MNKKKNLIMCLAAPVAAFFVQQAISIIWMELYVGYTLANYPGGDYMKYMEESINGMMNPTAIAIASLIYAVICTVWFGIWYYGLRYNVNKEEGFGPAVVKDRAVEAVGRQRGIFEGYSPTIIPGLIILACGGQFVCGFLSEFVGSLAPQWYDYYEKLTESMGLTSDKIGIWLVLYAIIVGPICEELTFRGLCYTYARRATGFIVANIIQALLFGIMHLNPLQGIFTFIVGLVFGVIYEKSRNIFVTMGLHILFNLSGIVLAPVLTTGDTPFKFFVILLCSLLASYVGYEIVMRAIPQHIDIELR